MKQFDMSGVQGIKEGESRRLPAGGYVCRITGARDVPDKEQLVIEFDIAEGEYKGFYAESFQRYGSWHGILYRSYKESALGFFKGFISSVEESNPGYKWNWDEKTLAGKLIGIVMGEEEYVRRGETEIRVSVKPQQVRGADVIRKGGFKVPEIRRLREDQKPMQASSGYTQVDNEHLPF